MKKPYKKAVAILLALILFAVSVPLSVSARTETDPYQFIHDEDYIYWYRSPHRYAYMENGEEHYPYIPAMYNLLYNEQSLAVYCCDLITSVVEGTAYKRINLEDSGYFSDDYAAHIRGIFANGYQHGFTASDLTALAQKAGISDTSSLTAAEALSATQTAIWTYANNGVLSDIYYGTRTITSTSDIKDPVTVNVAEGGKSYTTEIAKTASNIQKVYDYLIQQKNAAPKSVVWSLDDDIKVLTVKEGSSYDVTVKFKINGSNDSVAAVLYADLLKDTSVVDTKMLNFTGKNYPEKDSAGYYTVTFENVSENDIQNNSVKLSLSGTQELATDVYFYDPEGGRHNAQSFVGIGGGTTPISDTATASFEVGTQSLSIYTYDEDAGGNKEDHPISGAEFELFVSVDGAEPEPCLVPKTTDKNGTVTWEGLTKGDNIKYYYKQKSSIDGYEDVSEQIKEFGDSDSVSVANKRELADLTVGNNIEGTDIHFTYTVELDLSKSDLVSNEFDWLDLNKEYDSVKVEYSNSCGDTSSHSDKISFTENKDGKLVARFVLSNGEEITLKDLPVGAKYSVSETDNADHEMKDNTVTEVSDKLYSCEDGSQNGTVSSDSEANELQFKNKEHLPESNETTTEITESTTSANETTTSADETTTLEDETTTSADETTTLEDETTTSADETTTLEDETTTSADETTTIADETTTSASETTTLADETTTSASETTTSASETTTLANETTTLAEKTTESQESEKDEEQTTNKQSTQTSSTTQKGESETAEGTTAAIGQTNSEETTASDVPGTGSDIRADVIAVAFAAVGLVLFFVSKKKRITE